MSADRPAKGIRRTVSGWQVYVRVKGEFRSKHFKPDTDLLEMKQWRDGMKARGWLKMPEPDPESDDFAADCATYLKLVAGMQTIKDRTYRIHQWREALGGNVPRSGMTAVDIRRALEQWRVKGLSPGSLNLRRTALQHLFSVLDGKSGHNPVKDVPRYREIARPLHLPTIPHAVKAIRALQPGSKSRARALVLLWTGWPPAQLMRLTPEDIDRRGKRARLTGRIKGKGTPARWLPLLPQAVAALRELHLADAFGPFSTHALRHRLHRACDRASIRRFNPYHLRHLFLTFVAMATKDDRVVAELALHADPKTTRRYTEGSVDQRLTDGLKAVQRSLITNKPKNQTT